MYGLDNLHWDVLVHRYFQWCVRKVFVLEKKVLWVKRGRVFWGGFLRYSILLGRVYSSKRHSKVRVLLTLSKGVPSLIWVMDTTSSNSSPIFGREIPSLIQTLGWVTFQTRAYVLNEEHLRRPALFEQGLLLGERVASRWRFWIYRIQVRCSKPFTSTKEKTLLFFCSCWAATIFLKILCEAWQDLRAVRMQLLLELLKLPRQMRLKCIWNKIFVFLLGRVSVIWTSARFWWKGALFQVKKLHRILFIIFSL